MASQHTAEFKQERILGGATRNTLEAILVSVLMAH